MTQTDAERRLFVEVVSSPGSWLLSADRLLCAAARLWEHTCEKGFQALDSVLKGGPALTEKARQQALRDTGHGQSFMLLAGFGIENLVKAIRVRNLDPDKVISEKGKLGNALRSHDTVTLARDGGFEPTEEEEALMRRLWHHVVWAGRYPAGVDDLKPLKNPAGWMEPTTKSDDMARIEALAQRLRDFIDQA